MSKRSSSKSPTPVQMDKKKNNDRKTESEMKTLNQTPNSSDFYKKGLKFECQGSGKCCTSHGEYGFVFLTLKDRQRMARYLKISTLQFTKTYCQKTKGYFHLREETGKPDCMFLKNKACSIYTARPTQCRTWPFWPEVLNAKTWAKEVASFCPGVNKGKLFTAEEINKIQEEQYQSEMDLHREAIL